MKGELSISGTKIESTNHILLQCSLYLSGRPTLLKKIRNVEILPLDQNENCLYLVSDILLDSEYTTTLLS